VKTSSITPALLPSGTDACVAEHLLELSEEEAAQRRRLELKVERALYRAAAALQELGHHMATHSPQYSVEHYWRRDPTVQKFLQEATIALHNLSDRQLYRSTHQSEDRYCRERFGSLVQDYSPVMALEP